jgi:hypothetical protein
MEEWLCFNFNDIALAGISRCQGQKLSLWNKSYQQKTKKWSNVEQSGDIFFILAN